MNDVPNEMTAEEIRIKIIHLMKIYPIISPTMLQGGLGPSMKPALWRPVLDELIQEDVILQEQESMTTPSGRYNSYPKLRLAGANVTFDE